MGPPNWGGPWVADVGDQMALALRLLGEGETQSQTAADLQMLNPGMSAQLADAIAGTARLARLAAESLGAVPPVPIPVVGLVPAGTTYADVTFDYLDPKTGQTRQGFVRVPVNAADVQGTATDQAAAFLREMAQVYGFRAVPVPVNVNVVALLSGV